LSLATAYVDLPQSVSRPQGQQIVNQFKQNLSKEFPCYVNLSQFGPPQVELTLLKRDSAQLAQLRAKLMGLLGS